MPDIQIIEQDGRPAFYVVPADLWERVKDLIEDAQDVEAYDRAKRADDGFRVPHSVILAELAGKHAVQAWREYRGLSQEALAAAAGVSKGYISRIESGQRAGTTATLRRIAKALDVGIAELAEEE